MKQIRQPAWIWCAQNDPAEYNQTGWFRKEVDLKETGAATLRITADSWYRLFINGKWIHDGPGRAYPDHLQYDTHTVSLKKGKNRIEVIARYFGIGTFHQIPQQAGLWAQIKTVEGVVGTDESWLASPSCAWRQWVPKVSIQMEPVEEYDARLEKVLDWQPAVVVPRTGRLSPRQVGLLTQKPLRITSLHSSAVVKRMAPQSTVPVAQLAHPGLVEANGTVTRPVVLAGTLSVPRTQQFAFCSNDWKVATGGLLLKTGKVTLTAGTHTILFFCSSFTGHQKDLPFLWLNLKGARWIRWQLGVLDEFLMAGYDRLWFSFPNQQIETLRAGWMKKIEELAKAGELPAESLRPLPLEQIFLPDASAEFAAREPIGSAARLFDGTVVQPSRNGDVELCFDFGGQVCGYFDFTIKAEEGVIIDLNAIEFIREDGVLQHVHKWNRNGMRYVTKKGVNRFTSLKRRSGRYLFVTLRNQKTPVEIKNLRIIESTAPVEPVGSFSCSDPMLNRVWKMSERTLQLCMEDTFTDCPLFEQTLWIGDARNEALYAFAAYANFDVSERSLEIGAQSLEQFPIVGCQVPSSWDCILPAWSFLWGIHVWEHYFYSADRKLLRKLWHAVQQNIDGALGMLNQKGLFTGKFWNLIEWAPIDEAQPTVLHNNMLLVGALRAAENCAEILNDSVTQKRLVAARKKLIRAIQKTWNEQKNSYPDSLRENGKPSPKICQHTSMFPVMFDMVPRGKKEILRQNLLNPPEEMTTVSAPFAMQFMYEALEKMGEFDALLNSIRTGFQPMVDAGADTVWETFAGSTCSPKGFPTRSHCHAWSSSPIYFLNRIVLGIRQTASGGKAFEISPWTGDLKKAGGATATPKGPVSVKWQIKGQTLRIKISAPAGVKTIFKPNASHDGMDVILEK